MKQTAVEWLFEQIVNRTERVYFIKELEQAKEMEKNNTDNKVIHFAEWLTNKHTTILITLYEQFEEQYYSENFKSDQ